jgi:hexosaminidase
MRNWILLGCILFLINAKAQLNIVPMPASVVMGKGLTVIKEPLGFIIHDFDEADTDDNNGSRMFREYLAKQYGIKKIVEGDSHSYGLATEIHYGTADSQQVPGSYQLKIEPKRIYIKGDAMGRFYAFQTLKQLVTVNAKKEVTVPICTINDYPRFVYRGMHLDVARHFFSVDYVKKYIDYLAFYKFNTLHWHLTDDQGWRIEIKKYPKLTEVGAWRNGTIIGRYPGKGSDNTPYGGFYTQEQVKDIVQYAANRHITVIPEIELPGHSSAAIAAYPQLSCFPEQKTDIPANMISNKSKAASGKLVQETWGVFEDVFCPTEYTFSFMENVLDEVMALFPSKYIHIGGDECPKDAWKKSPFCQQLMKEKGLKDEHELQSYFIQRIEKHINSKGRQIIGWDEILEGGLAPNATVMSWQGEEGGIAAAKQQHHVIMTPGSHCYLDHSQTVNEDSVTIGSYLPVEKVYGYEPIPKALNKKEAAYVLGAQGNLWTEYITNSAKLEYMIFPRMAALAEVLWSPKAKRNWPDFERRLPHTLKLYNSWGANYSKAYFDIKATVMPAPDFNGVLWKLESNLKRCEIFYTNANDKGKGYYKEPIKISGSWVATASTMVNGKQVGNRIGQSFNFNKATGKKILLTNQPSDSYPGNGAFTLVDGVQNEKGFARAGEFLGFMGTDCEALIDFGTPQSITSITIHALSQAASWIWQPLAVSVMASVDGINYKEMGLTDDFIKSDNSRGVMAISFDAAPARYVKVKIKNWGEISAGNPGAGKKAWLFVDEIEIR